MYKGNQAASFRILQITVVTAECREAIGIPYANILLPSQRLYCFNDQMLLMKKCNFQA